MQEGRPTPFLYHYLLQGGATPRMFCFFAFFKSHFLTEYQTRRLNRQSFSDVIDVLQTVTR
jgi:hypothetical protein